MQAKCIYAEAMGIQPASRLEAAAAEVTLRAMQTSRTRFRLEGATSGSHSRCRRSELMILCARIGYNP